MTSVESEINGTVWKVLASQGEAVAIDQEVLVLESMKMEIPVYAPESGILEELLVEEGSSVAEGEVLFRISPVS